MFLRKRLKVHMLVSILIPTRNGSSTIKGMISSALNQTNKNFEIIVLDDSINNETKNIIKQFRSSKIKYFKTKSPGNSMCDNWELVVKKSKGDMVFIVGDDDAVMPNAVEKIQEVYKTYKSEIIQWSPHQFYWPGVMSKNAIALRSDNKNIFRIINIEKKVKKIFDFGGSFLNQLPMIYHSAISRKLINNIIKNTGRLFHSKQPDVFSGMAFAAFTSSAIRIETPLTVNAWSLRSNSGSMRKEYSSKKNLEYINEFKDIYFHKSLPDDHRMAFFNTTPDAILTAKDMFPSYFDRFIFNYSAMFAIFVRLSHYKNYGWILRNRKTLSISSGFSLNKFHFYLILNIVVTLRDKIKKISYINRKVKSQSPETWILNEVDN